MSIKVYFGHYFDNIKMDRRGLNFSTQLQIILENFPFI